ncbi:MAG: DUF2520 domain-containing protein [Firmicutes bacterium HGW-Firmicutes-7]|nr:MAG: DUF2520 domain-containing protein [Firmicutes bacterium HGW-Firmicutes-7]
MRMSFIGAGKVGTSLGLYLKNKGFIISGYYSKSYASATNAGELTGSIPFRSLEELAVESDMIWITTNDDSIEEIGHQLAALKCVSEGTIIAHASGAHSSEILAGLKERGCFIYSIHPLQAFAQVETAVEELKATVFTIEGDQEKRALIKKIFNRTGNSCFIIEKEGKALYHAGACIMSNYLITLIDVALNLFQQAGLDRKKILEATRPLIMGTLNNIQLKDTKNALTGPIQRGDEVTIKNHIAAIGDNLPQEKEFYKFMGLKTLEMIKDSKSEEQIEMLMRLFEGGVYNE